jgi:hypothetical protein
MELINLIYGIISIISMLSSIYVLSQPLRFFVKTKQSPGIVLKLVGLKAIADFVYAFKFFAQAFWHAERTDPALCSFYSWLTYYAILASTSYNFAISIEVYIVTAFGVSGRPKLLAQERVLPAYVAFNTILPVTFASVLVRNGCAVYSETFRDCGLYDFQNTVLWPAWQIWLILAPIMFYLSFSCFTLAFVVYRSYRELSLFVDPRASVSPLIVVQAKVRRKMVLFTVLFIAQWTPLLAVFAYVFAGQEFPMWMIYWVRFVEHSVGFFDALVWFSNIEDLLQSANVSSLRSTFSHSESAPIDTKEITSSQEMSKTETGV